VPSSKWPVGCSLPSEVVIAPMVILRTDTAVCKTLRMWVGLKASLGLHCLICEMGRWLLVRRLLGGVGEVPAAEGAAHGVFQL
jgi:hypothetical protein